MLQINTDIMEVQVTLLHPHGPSHSFRYPAKQHIIGIPLPNILTKVDPRTVTGHVYTLTKRETETTTEKFSVAATK